MFMRQPQQETIINKRKGRHEDDHANHSWKIAYADFTTAMMAFFIVLWLIAVTSKSQRDGLADFFNPVSVSRSHSGANGVLSGRSVDEGEHSLVSPSASGVLATPVSSPPVESKIGTQERAPFLVGQIGEPTQGGAQSEGGQDRLSDEDGPSGWDGASQEEDRRGRVVQRGPSTESALESSFGASDIPGAGSASGISGVENVVSTLFQNIVSDPTLVDVLDAVNVAYTPDGVEIEVKDQEEYFALFERGGARLNPRARRIIAIIAEALKEVPNPVSIEGHTDATRYRPGATYTNWELSADRANAARRALIQDGVAEDRIARIEGKAATEPKIVEDTRDPRNRRIVFTLLGAQPGSPGLPSSPSASAQVGSEGPARSSAELLDLLPR